MSGVCIPGVCWGSKRSPLSPLEWSMNMVDVENPMLDPG